MIPVDDLVSVLDVLAVDVEAVDSFGGAANLEAKRRVAVQDWLCPLLEQAKYPVRKHKTRRPPEGAFSFTGGAWEDRKDAFANVDTNLVDLLTGANDAIYIGLSIPFKGLLASIEDAINPVVATTSITYWNGTWSAFTSVTNQTYANSVPFARAGRITWPEPADWLVRELRDVPAYWCRLSLSAAPTSGTLHQLLPIARSRLTYPVVLRTLSQLYAEGTGANRGEWEQKAAAFEQRASAALTLVLPQVVDEFDADDDGAAETSDVNSIAMQAEPFTWERG